MANPRGRADWRFAAYATSILGPILVGGPLGYFILVAGSLVASALFPNTRQEDDTSPSYEWKRSPNTTASHDTVMPIIYGKARVKPIVKNRFITTEGDKQYLNVLYGFAGHRIDELDLPYWNDRASWVGGSVVRLAITPGMTYRCHLRQDEETFNSPLVINGDWDVWHGSAAITDILLNGSAIENFDVGNSENFHYETRPGFALQTVIEGFEDTYTNYPDGTNVSVDYPSMPGALGGFFRTASTPAAKIFAYYKGEKYKVNLKDELNYAYWSAGLPGRMRYSTRDDVSVSLGYLIASRSESYWNIQTPTSADWSQTSMLVGNTDNIQVDLFFPSGLFATDMNGTLIKAYCAIFAQYRRRYADGTTDDWVNFDFYDNLANLKSGTDTTTVRELTDATTGASVWSAAFNLRTVNPIWRTIHAVRRDAPLDNGMYDVRVSALSPTTVTVDTISSISYGVADRDGVVRGFTYPGETLLGIRALATSELAGDITVTGVVERSTVPVWNGRTGAWVNGDATNHGWVCYDILANGHTDHPEYPNMTNNFLEIQPIYGCGVSRDNLDYETFRTWVEFTNGTNVDQLGYELNIVFDTRMTAWDAILRICSEGRGMVYAVGATYYALADSRVTDVVAGATTNADVNQLFSMGNINLESFTQQWIDVSKKATAIEVTYFDADRLYARTMFVVRTSDWDTDDSLNDPMRLTLYGTTSYAQAFGLATYLLNCNEKLSQTLVFDTAVEALTAQVGDVVRVQHASLTGIGGKLVAYSDPVTNVVTLDKTITLVGGTTYYFALQLSDGNLRVKTVTGSGSTTTIDFGFPGDRWSTDPAQYDSWAFGELTTYSRLFRIIDIEAAGDLTRQITCLEYDPAVYQSDVNSAQTLTQANAAITSGKYAAGGENTVVNVAKAAPDLSLPTLTTYHTAANLEIREIITRNRTTGAYESLLSVSWDHTEGENWGEWGVRYRDVDISDVWKGIWSVGSYDVYDRVEHGGFVFVSLVANNTSTPFVR